jgi:hypothetical protein
MRLHITFGFVAITAAISGAGCGAKETSGQNAAAATGGTATSGGGKGGGAAAEGGSNGAAGAGATGGSLPTGQVGTLGQNCGAPGTLACAGNYQKLTLVCGADGRWAVNQTCSGDQICDTRAGVNAGTCRDQDPQCLGHDPGYKLCIGDAVYACGADNLSTALVESCAATCENGACNNAADPCPASGTVCSSDCGGPSAACIAGDCPSVSGVPYGDIVGSIQIVRTVDAASSCWCAGGRKYLAIFDDGQQTIRISVKPPWWVMVLVDSYSVSPACNATAGPQCLVSTAQITQNRRMVLIMTDDQAAQERNVTIETVAPGAVCP